MSDSEDLWRAVAELRTRVSDLELGLRDAHEKIDKLSTPKTKDGRNLEDRLTRDVGVVHEQTIKSERRLEKMIRDVDRGYRILVAHLKNYGTAKLDKIAPEDDDPTKEGDGS